MPQKDFLSGLHNEEELERRNKWWIPFFTFAALALTFFFYQDGYSLIFYINRSHIQSIEPLIYSGILLILHPVVVYMLYTKRKIGWVLLVVEQISILLIYVKNILPVIFRGINWAYFPIWGNLVMLIRLALLIFAFNSNIRYAFDIEKKDSQKAIGVGIALFIIAVISQLIVSEGIAI